MTRHLLKLIGLGFTAGLWLGFLIPLLSEPAIPLQPISSETTPSVRHGAKAAARAAQASLDVSDAPVRLEIQLSRRQVVLYDGATQVKQYPIAIGRQGWETPTGRFKVLDTQQNPTWIHPLTDEVIPGGDSRNPLGAYWIGFWTDGHNWIGFHGTPNPETVGQAISHGCIRMYNQDIQELYHQVRLGTPVTVVE